jgi:hypothetical protein
MDAEWDERRNAASISFWKRVDALTGNESKRGAVASDPDTWIPDDEEWTGAKVIWPPGKEPVTICIDQDIL